MSDQILDHQGPSFTKEQFNMSICLKSTPANYNPPKESSKKTVRNYTKESLHMSQGLNSLYWGWETSHLLIGNPYNGYINPYYWVEFPIPYYMEIMGVDRPDRTYRGSTKKKSFPKGSNEIPIDLPRSVHQGCDRTDGMVPVPFLWSDGFKM